MQIITVELDLLVGKEPVAVIYESSPYSAWLSHHERKCRQASVQWECLVVLSISSCT